jgi:hypothetical protein
MEEPLIKIKSYEKEKEEEILKRYGIMDDIYLRANIISKLFLYWDIR